MFIYNVSNYFVFSINGAVVLYRIFKLWNIWLFNEEYANKHFLTIRLGDLY